MNTTTVAHVPSLSYYVLLKLKSSTVIQPATGIRVRSLTTQDGSQVLSFGLRRQSLSMSKWYLEARVRLLPVRPWRLLLLARHFWPRREGKSAVSDPAPVRNQCWRPWQVPAPLLQRV